MGYSKWNRVPSVPAVGCPLSSISLYQTRMSAEKFVQSLTEFVDHCSNILLGSRKTGNTAKNLKRYKASIKECLKLDLIDNHFSLFKKVLARMESLVIAYDYDDSWVLKKKTPYIVAYTTKSGEVRDNISIEMTAIYKLCRSGSDKYLFMKHLFALLSTVSEDKAEIKRLREISKHYQEKIDNLSEDDDDESDSSSDDSNEMGKIMSQISQGKHMGQLGAGIGKVMKELNIDTDKLGDIMRRREGDSEESSNGDSEDPASELPDAPSAKIKQIANETKEKLKERKSKD